MFRYKDSELLPHSISRRSILFCDGADLQPRGSIFTKETDKPTMKDYVREWNRLGFGEVVDRFRKQHSQEKLQSLIENSYISEKRQKALLRLIVKRSEELCEI